MMWWLKITQKLLKSMPQPDFECFLFANWICCSQSQDPSETFEIPIWLRFGLFRKFCCLNSWKWLKNSWILGCGFGNRNVEACLLSRSRSQNCTGVVFCDSGIAKVCKKAIGWTKSGLGFEGLAISPCQSQNSTKKVLFYLWRKIKNVEKFEKLKVKAEEKWGVKPLNFLQLYM